MIHRAHRLWLLCATAGLLAMAGVPAAHAQGGIDSTAHYRTTPGTNRLSNLSLSPVEPRYRWLVGLLYNYNRAPISGENVGLIGTRNLISDQHLGELQIVVGLPRVDVGLAFPFIINQQGEPWTDHQGESLDGVSGGAVGDLRLHAKVNVLDPRRYGVGLAAAVSLTTPTGQVDRYAGNRGVVLGGRLVLDYWIGRTAVFAINVGYVFRSHTERVEDLRIDDAFELGAGVRISFAEYGLPFSIFGEIVASTQIDDLFDSGRGSPVEGRFGLRIWNTQNFFIGIGWGVGVNRGGGLPRYRVLVDIGLTFDTPWRKAPKRVEPDRDGDGIPDAHDGCPDKPEDYDEFEDADGCPEASAATVPKADQERRQRDQRPEWWQKWRWKHKRRMQERERKRKAQEASKARARSRKRARPGGLPDLAPQTRSIGDRAKRLGRTVKKLGQRVKRGTGQVKGSVRGIKRALPRKPPRRRPPRGSSPRRSAGPPP